MKAFKTFTLLSLVFALCNCSQDDNLAQSPDGDNNLNNTTPALITTGIVTKDGKSISIELNESSTITFTDEYMVIDNNGQETKIKLDDVSSLSYNPETTE